MREKANQLSAICQLAYKLYIFLLLLAPLTSYFIRNILNLPNFVAPFRDAILLLLFFISLLQKKALKNPSMMLSFAAFICFLVLYLLSSILQNRLYPGLYYLRFYSFPLIFFWVSAVYFAGFTKSQLSRIYRFIIAANVIIIALGFFFYINSFIDFNFLLNIIRSSPDEKFHSWTIYKGFIVRAGLPLSGPNEFGLYLSLSICFLYFSLKHTVFAHTKKIYSLITANVILLCATASRSSLIFLFVAIASAGLINSRKYFKSSLKISLFFAGAGAAALIALNVLTEGMLIKWIITILTIEDQSMVGHGHSYVYAIKQVGDYIFFGFPKGSVGPLSSYFNNDITYSVESSVFIVLFDMGIFTAAIFLLSYCMIFSAFKITTWQLSILCGIFCVFQLLPTILSASAIAYFFLIFISLKYGYLLNRNHPAAAHS